MSLHIVLICVAAVIVIGVGIKWTFFSKDGFRKPPQIPDVDLQNQQIDKENSGK